MKIKNTDHKHIEGIALVEFDRYEELYKNFPDKKLQFNKTIKKRIQVARKWMWVLLDDEKVLGSLSAQPTTKKMENFTSWEDSTDNGTLESTFDASGDNVYVVNLDVLREGTKKGGQYMIMAYLAAKVIEENKNLVFFESRMPGFQEWYIVERKGTMKTWSDLADSEKQLIAEEYACLEIEKNDKRVVRDRLLRFYDGSGFKAYDIVLNAFEDPESLDCGVVFFAKNPLPKLLRIYGIRHFIAAIVRAFSKSPKILDLLV